MRALCVRLHRYVGLALAGFLAFSGLSGGMLVFQAELDAWLNPALFRVAPGGPALPPAELAARVARADPRLAVTALPLRIESGATARLQISPRIDSATGQPFALDFDEVFADPASGAILGRRLWGECHWRRAALVPCLYVLHYSLQAPGATGLWIMGGMALAWIFAALLGVYLTFPAKWRDGGGRSWRQRWGVAWKIKRGARGPRLHMDWHRAGGLWLFPALLILAVSGISFNLRDAVFEPVVGLFSSLTPSPFDQREEQPDGASPEPRQSFATILARAEPEAARRGWTEPAADLFYNPGYGIYGVGFGAARAAGLGPSYLYFDGDDGRLLGDYRPGAGTAGDVFESLQLPLHSGRIAGWPGRIAVAATGLAVAGLSLTGVLIWLDKRRARDKKLGA
ncbi:Uncharacterized iron-regulated membrane protein [Methylomagnum ishizawai]|uniref:Uncharacterized iron-regulated membrane protein n=1 Tax=Methylomagnum ishizawai TaxID=1760988 RepID=A0A1Y6D3C5_9GAMM|nr:PepSY-associated TM helix domain-containing protein [Methylomagnum ishizawai]SMF97448.1 Uncharacterized iron-regulated membrane protein [Methylomagnum ishizawai]